MSKEINKNMTSETKEKKMNLKNIEKSFKSQQFKSGAYSSVLTILVIAIVIVINLVFAKLDLSTDLSQGGLFTLSKDSKKVIEEMDQDLTIYYMVEDGKESVYIYNVLKQYDKFSKHISLKKVDPVVNPGFASKQGINEEIASNDVIVVNNKTKAAKYVSSYDMYVSSQSYTSENSEDYLDTEGQVTSAIQNVLSESTTKMYVMTKHSETELGSSLTSALDKLNVETEELELATKEAVPKDCNILLINGITTDLTDAEKEMVLDYLKAGGAAMINLAYTENELPNFEEVLEYYGIHLTKGVVFESTGNYATYPNCILPQANSENDLLNDVEGYVIFPNAIGLSAAGGDSLRSSVSITDIMSTSEDAYAKMNMASDTIDKEDGDVDGPFLAGVSVEEELESDKKTQLIVYSSAGAFSEDFTATSQLGNADVFNKSVSSMIASDIRKVSIEAKSLSYSYISVQPGMQLFWAAVIIIIIPAGLLIAGFGIWFMRRRK